MKKDLKHVHYIVKRRKTKTMLHTSIAEVLNIANITSAGATLLYLAYLEIANLESPNMEDIALSHRMKKTITTIRDNRLLLTKAGFFLRTKTTKKRVRTLIYYLGKDEVDEHIKQTQAVNNYRNDK